MELDSLLTRDAHEAGAEVNILNPNTGNPTDVFIKVLGVDSREWQKSLRVSRNRFLEELAENKEIGEDARIESELAQLVSVTVGWRGLERDGEPVEFSKEACRDLYERAPAVFDQVDRFVGDRLNFTSD